MMNYTVYQWTSGNFSWDPPGRIEGPVRMQAKLALTTGYTGTWSGSPRNQFLSDLNAMRLANPSLGDYRPFNNLPISPQLYLQNSLQASDTISLLKTNLGIATVDTAPKAATGMTFPTTFSTYRLYPGGKTYNVTQLTSSTIHSTDVCCQAPDPTTNPAGLYFRTGSLTVSDNATHYRHGVHCRQ